MVIRKLVLVILMLLLSTLTVAADSYINNQLDDIYSFYQDNKGVESVEKYVELDKRLRQFMSSLPVGEHGYRIGNDREAWKKEYRHLGLGRDNYMGFFVYNEKFLSLAHKLNPHSKYRAYTLFSQVDYRSGLGVMPNIKMAKQYLKEFPHGPFSPEVMLTIADFNKDLYMVLRDNDRSYKYDCFKPYIQNDKSYDEQKEQVKNIALDFYAKYLQVKPNDIWASKFEKELRDDSITGWSFCAD